MKNKLFIKLLLLTMMIYGCKKSNNHKTDKELNKKHQSTVPSKKIVQNLDDKLFLKEFYLQFYASKTISLDKRKEDYLSLKFLQTLDSLSRLDELLLDYDPFIRAQDYDYKSIQNTLQIINKKNKNTYNISFKLFDSDLKKTSINIVLKYEENKPKIHSILGDSFFKFKNDIEKTPKNKTDEFEDDLETVSTYLHDLNSDGFNDKIIVYQNKYSQDKFNKRHFKLPIKIYKGDENGFSYWAYNNNLVFNGENNCIAEGYSRIITKKNYFTVEQNTCSNYISISSYTTFKIIDDQILLHKYGEEYFDKANHNKKIEPKIWTPKDFGKVKLEKIRKDFFLKLSQSNPK